AVVSLAWLIKWSVGRWRGHIDARLESGYVQRLNRHYRLLMVGNLGAAAHYWVVSLAVVSLAWLLKWSVGVSHGHIDARLELDYVRRLMRNFRLIAVGNLIAAVLVFFNWQAGLALSALLMAWHFFPPETPRYTTQAPVIEGER
ncbi:MAG: hypothetical protein ABIV11_11045, partial [Gemmatimonadaceae bacterium]